MKFGIVVFPGSNCDRDAYHAVHTVFGQPARFIWHKESTVGEIDCVILPGGFSYGDYLRSGAIARFSSVMKDVVRFAEQGGLVIGICNGFQILVESGLLPGALIRNRSLHFICRTLPLRVENNDTILTRGLERGEVIRIPIAHGEGNYVTDPETLRSMEDEGLIVFRYCAEDGSVTDEANPNGSLSNIAGIVNKRGNVFGMMPHPERAVDPELGLTDGRKLFESLLTEVLH